MEKYWICYNPKRSTPACGFSKHGSLTKAHEEAIRLCNTEQTEFYIFELVGGVKPIPRHEEIEVFDPMPF